MNKHLSLAIILAVFALFSFFLVFHNDAVWWDSAVYIGMGKYIWSGGEAGLFESSRPLVLLFLLGFFWKIGVNEFIAAKFLAVFFSLGTIFLVYVLGNRLYGERVGILAMLFVAFSQTFLSFSHPPLTEIPSTFFLLLGLWLFFEKKHFPAGILLGMSFLTRFFQIFFIAFFLITLFLSTKNRAGHFTMLKGLGLVVFPYFILSWAMFGSPLDPFIMQFYLSTNTGVIYSEHMFFYVIGLLKENFFVLALLALPLIKLSKETKTIAIPTLLTFLIYSAFSHKEMRLLLVILPFIMIITAHSAVSLYHLVSKLQKETAKAISVSLIAFWLALSFANIMPLLNSNNPINSQEQLFQAYMEKHQDKEYWISSPKYALFSDAKVLGLMYYPIVGKNPDVALANSCDFIGNNEAYTKKTSQHVAFVEQTMENTYTAAENGCVYRIFKKATS